MPHRTVLCIVRIAASSRPFVVMLHYQSCQPSGIIATFALLDHCHCSPISRYFVFRNAVPVLSDALQGPEPETGPIIQCRMYIWRSSLYRSMHIRVNSERVDHNRGLGPYTIFEFANNRSLDKILTRFTSSTAEIIPPSTTHRSKTSMSSDLSGCAVICDQTACSKRYKLEATWATNKRAGRGIKGGIGGVNANLRSISAPCKMSRGVEIKVRKAAGHNFITS
jgi:hypothetical protein